LLTAREHEVLEQIARGASNKETGRDLGISPRTVEVHRARIMEKLAAKNAADLMRIVLRAGSPPGRPTDAGSRGSVSRR
jgi:two-component system, LuxR family, response regulator FixJ